MAWRDVSRNTIAALFGVAFLLRLFAIMVLPAPELGTNAQEAYVGGARILVDGAGFRDPAFPLFTPPLYAVLIAAGIEVFGEEQLPIKVFQAIADSLVVSMLYAVSVVVFGVRTGVLAGVFTAFYPFSIYAASLIGAETLFGLFVVSFVLFALLAIDTDHWWWHCAAGVAAGLATMTRGSTQFLPLFWLATLWLFHGLDRRVLRGFAMFLACFVLVIAPWGIRNYVVTGQFVPVAMSGGLVAVCGSDEGFFTIPGRDERLRRYYDRLEERGIEYPSGPTRAQDWESYYMRAAIERYKIRLEEEPWSFPRLFALKFARLWYGTESGSRQGRILLANAVVYPFCIAGLVLAWRQRRKTSLVLLLPVVYLVLLHWAMHSMFRYMVPVMPLLLAFGAHAVVAALDRVRPGGGAPDGVGGRSP